VPSSYVGSCDSAKAAADRASGVDAAAGFAGVACAGFAPLAGTAAAGLAGSGAAPEPVAPEFCASAGAVASIAAMATIVIFRMSGALGSAAMALTLKSTSSAIEAEGTGSDLIRNCIFANVAHESCVLIKLLLRLLHCHNQTWTFVAFGMSQQ
jgi:hypothetical protein